MWTCDHILHARGTTDISGVVEKRRGIALQIMLSGVNSHIYIPSVQREKGRKKIHLNQEELHWKNACEVLNIELGTSYSSQLVFPVKIWKILATSSNGVIHCQYFKHKNPLHEVFGY